MVYNTIIRWWEYLTVTNITNGSTKAAGYFDKVVTATGSYDPLTQRGLWHIFEIPPGFTGQIGFTAEVAELKDGTEIPNVHHCQRPDRHGVRQMPYGDAVAGENVLTISKKVSNDKVEIGDPVRTAETSPMPARKRYMEWSSRTTCQEDSATASAKIGKESQRVSSDAATCAAHRDRTRRKAVIAMCASSSDTKLT